MLTKNMKPCISLVANLWVKLAGKFLFSLKGLYFLSHAPARRLYTMKERSVACATLSKLTRFVVNKFHTLIQFTMHAQVAIVWILSRGWVLRNGRATCRHIIPRSDQRALENALLLGSQTQAGVSIVHSLLCQVYFFRKTGMSRLN